LIRRNLALDARGVEFVDRFFLVPQAEVDRQGWGVVDPEAAVAAALEMRPRPERRRSPRVAEAVAGRSRA